MTGCLSTPRRIVLRPCGIDVVGVDVADGEVMCVIVMDIWQGPLRSKSPPKQTTLH